MGKNSALNSLGRRIGNVVLHKLLVEHTNRPESKNHLFSEEIEYRNSAIKEAKEYNWNSRDVEFIKKIAIKFIEEKRTKKYSDVDFSTNQADKLIIEEMENIGIIC